MPTKICTLCKKELSVACFGKHSSSSDGIRASCKGCNKAKTAAWRARNPDLVKDYADKNNKPQYRKHRQKRLQYVRDNRAKYNAIEASRRAQKNNATPPWLTEEHQAQINALYEEAKIWKELIGVDIHVDHIIPLKGENVCGLHVPWNLQLLTAKDNCSKSNRL